MKKRWNILFRGIFISISHVNHIIFEENKLNWLNRIETCMQRSIFRYIECENYLSIWEFRWHEGKVKIDGQIFTIRGIFEQVVSATNGQSTMILPSKFTESRSLDRFWFRILDWIFTEKWRKQIGRELVRICMKISILEY